MTRRGDTDMHSEHKRRTAQQKQRGRAVTNTPDFNHLQHRPIINLHQLAPCHTVTRGEMTCPATFANCRVLSQTWTSTTVHYCPAYWWKFHFSCSDFTTLISMIMMLSGWIISVFFYSMPVLSSDAFCVQMWSEHFFFLLVSPVSMGKYNQMSQECG